jgi:uncharacterized protein YfcZ (UPF0381/DUF406 family)
MDNENEVKESAINDTLDQELEINLDTTDGDAVDSKEVVDKQKFDQVFARMKKAEEAVKSLKSKSQEVKGETPTPTDKKEFEMDEVAELRFDGYNKEETKFIMQNGGRKALESNPFVKVAIDKIREQKRAEQAIPEEDTGKSEIERKYTQEQLSKMSADELYKILPKAPNA